MKLYHLLLSALLSICLAHAQPDQRCKVSVIVGIRDSVYELTSDQGYITFNYESGKFNLTLPINSLYSPLDTIAAFIKTSNGYLTYKGTTNVNSFDLTNTQMNTNKYFPMEGLLSLNGITKGIISQYALSKLNDGRDNTDRQMRITLMMNINPIDFGITKQFPNVNKLIRVEIIEQPLNRSFD
jgi:polyisoprenoid-binding protein YceI